MKTKRGISLIVLVITIIVMIILASAIILSLSSSGIIGKANQAVTDTDNSNLKEAAALAVAEYELEVNVGGLDPSETTVDEYVKEKLGKQGFSKEQLNLFTVSDSGNIFIVKIPKGFVASIYEGEQSISDGLVIYETKSLKGVSHEKAMTTYNQYVWVPVGDMSIFTATAWSNNAPVRGLSTNYTEPYSYNSSITAENDLTGEYAEYAKMVASVEKNGGFYIARYEAGDGTTDSARTEVTNEKTDKRTVVSKKNAYVYNYVPWGESMTSIAQFTKNGVDNVAGAVELSRSIYPVSSDKEVVSTLIYGVQWDATLRWLSDKYNVTDSRSWGNYRDSIDEAATNSGSSNMNYTTGRNEAWKAKNIYDLAGNVFEWTMEAVAATSRIARGATYNHGESSSSASYRSGYSPYNVGANYGFRFTLYIK